MDSSIAYHYRPQRDGFQGTIVVVIVVVYSGKVDANIDNSQLMLSGKLSVERETHNESLSDNILVSRVNKNDYNFQLRELI